MALEPTPNSNIRDIISKLEAENSPVEIVILSQSRLSTKCELVWHPMGGDSHTVGSMEVHGTVEGKRTFVLQTERLSFRRSNSFGGPSVKYKNPKAVVQGLLKWCVPLKRDEWLHMKRHSAKKKLDNARADIKDDFGAAHRAITSHWDVVYDLLVSGRKGTKLKRLVSDLKALEGQFAVAQEEYERSIHAEVREEEA